MNVIHLFLHQSPLFQRVVTALILATVFFGVLTWGYGPFSVLLFCVFLLGLAEWKRMVQQSSLTAYLKYLWGFLGAVYIFLGFLGFAILSCDNPLLVAIVLVLIWATDIGAFFIGRTLGGPKLAPKISPGKTWSGALGGLLVSVGLGSLLIYCLNNQLSILYTIGFFCISFVSILGDLLESYAKRKMGVKDSGTLLPGHGGVLDRLDSPLAVGVLLTIGLLCHRPLTIRLLGL